MSPENLPPSDSGEALRHAKYAAARLVEIHNALPAANDISAFESALERATESLSPTSVSAALRDQDASHITARLDLVIALCNEIHIATSLLAEVAEKLRRDCDAIANTIEAPDDSDY